VPEGAKPWRGAPDDTEGMTSRQAPTLVLASGSSARLRLLRDAGFDPEVVVSGVSEETDAVGTDRAVVELAERKARRVAGRYADHLVLGCDSLFDLGGAALGKPSSASEAISIWRRLRGSQGVLHTGHCLIDTRTDRRLSRLASTVVRFGTPSEDEISAYVASGEPLSLAGAFSIDGRAAPFIEGIDGDPGNVIGLSLPLLRRMLDEIDVRIIDLWRGTNS
jgi:septum formation protein